MIIIKFLGQDSLFLADFTKKIHKDLVDLFECKDEDLNFIASESFFIHNGQEQTSYYIDCEICVEHKYLTLIPNVVKYLQKKFKEIAINSVISVTHIHEQYIAIDEDYPLYMSPANMVKTSDAYFDEDGEDEAEEESEISQQMNDIFSRIDNGDDVDTILSQYDSLFRPIKKEKHTCCEGDNCENNE